MATEVAKEQEANFYAGLATNGVAYTSPVTGKVYKVVRVRENYQLDVDGEPVRRERDGARWETFTRMTVVRRAEKIDREAALHA